MLLAPLFLSLVLECGCRPCCRDKILQGLFPGILTHLLKPEFFFELADGFTYLMEFTGRFDTRLFYGLYQVLGIFQFRTAL